MIPKPYTAIYLNNWEILDSDRHRRKNAAARAILSALHNGTCTEAYIYKSSIGKHPWRDYAPIAHYIMSDGKVLFEDLEKKS
jgi:hypothetical protein